MGLKTAEPFFTFNPIPDATAIGQAVGLLEDEHGGQVFLHGVLAYVWDADDDAARRSTAVTLWRIKAATAAQIGEAFGVGEDSIWRWHRALKTSGLGILTTGKTGPKGGSKLTPELVTQIHELKTTKLSNVKIGATVGVSEFSVRRALTLDPDTGHPPVDATHPGFPTQVPAGHVQDELPMLADPEPRAAERVAASTGLLTEAAPVFTPAARVPYAGLFLALPALAATGLLGCVHEVYGCLKPGFYGLNTVILETVLRTLAGEPRAEGATRLDPVGFGRILGMDRAPEVKTVRRKHQELAGEGKAGELLEALGRHHLATRDTTGEDGLGLLLYVDGHVRSYQGTKKVAKQYSTRLKHPVPASMETWVADADGSPVFMVMAEPSSSLVGELRRLTPTLRQMIGDDRRVLIGFDREGWSPQLFHDLSQAGFDPLTWRKGEAEEVDAKLFSKHTYTDIWGRDHTYDQVADTTITLEYGPKGKETRFRMRQISRIVAAGKQMREATGQDTRQIHILTSNTTLEASEVAYRMSARWRHENYFRYARQHFALDAHDSYQGVLDDAQRSVPNPAKAKAKTKRDALAAKLTTLVAAVGAQELALSTPEPGETMLITNQMLNDLNAPVIKVEKELAQADEVYQSIPGRLPLGEVNPGQQVLESEMKQLLHGFRMAAYNASMILATEVRTNTGFKAAVTQAHAFVRQVLTHTGDIDPRDEGFLDVALDPLPTGRATAALGELCERLTATQTVYPGTDRVLRYRVKTLA